MLMIQYRWPKEVFTFHPSSHEEQGTFENFCIQYVLTSLFLGEMIEKDEAYWDIEL